MNAREKASCLCRVRKVVVLRPVNFFYEFYTDQNVVVFLMKNGHLRFFAKDHVVAINDVEYV